MAHRSRKKHLKHLHQHEPATPPAKSPIAKAEAVEARFAKPRAAASNARAKATAKAASVRAAVSARTKQASAKRGIVRTVASKVTAKVTARPKRILEKAARRVKSILGKDSEANRS